MTTAALVCHPATPAAAMRAFAVEVARPRPSSLRLRYRIDSPHGLVLLPTPGAPRRADELWRHTCCEAFLWRAGEPSYWELNLSPSTSWALYHFTSYRSGQSCPTLDEPPAVTVRQSDSGFELEAEVHLDGLDRWRPDQGLLVAPAAVVETATGLSYWALRHGRERPDFHLRSGAALTLTA